MLRNPTCDDFGAAGAAPPHSRDADLDVDGELPEMRGMDGPSAERLGESGCGFSAGAERS